LHYLWDQAELTRWHPGFAGKRSWATVRRKLVQAALHKSTRGHSLGSRLYLPEPFSVDERDAINARRLAQWQQAAATPGKPQNLMLLIGEVKEIMPARYGFKAVVKHMPDQAFAIDEQIYRRLGRRFESELALWGASDDIHMVMIATFGVGSGGVPAIHELCLMPVTAQWLPIEDSFERQLVNELVASRRAFIKGLRYNLHREQCIANATLTDRSGIQSLMFIVQPGYGESASFNSMTSAHSPKDPPVWIWNPAAECMPQMPPP
jgi:hypothetical protein